MNEQLVIKNIPQSNLLPAVLICILCGICVYNIYGLVACIARRKKYRAAAGLIIDGHEILKKEKPADTVDGKNLDSSLVVEQIEINKKKIEKIKKECWRQDEKKKRKADRKEKIKKKDTAVKKNRIGRRDSNIESMLNAIYQEDDFFESILGLYYEIKLPQIRDPAIREVVLVKTNGKSRNGMSRPDRRGMSKRKEKPLVHWESADADIRIFD